MTPLERLKYEARHPAHRVCYVDPKDLALALGVIQKAIETSETGGDDMDRALEDLWTALEPLTKDQP